jgi:hypothetical protein
MSVLFVKTKRQCFIYVRALKHKATLITRGGGGAKLEIHACSGVPTCPCSTTKRIIPNTHRSQLPELLFLRYEQAIINSRLSHYSSTGLNYTCSSKWVSQCHVTWRTVISIVSRVDSRRAVYRLCSFPGNNSHAPILQSKTKTVRQPLDLIFGDSERCHLIHCHTPNCEKPTAPPPPKAELDISRNRRQCITARQSHSMFRERLSKPTNLGMADVRTKTNFLP